MRAQNSEGVSVFQQIDKLFFHIVKRWLPFLYPPIPVRLNGPLSFSDEGADAKLPGLRTLLKKYEVRVTEVGGLCVIGGVTFTFALSQLWPFLVGSGINLILILVLLRYRFHFRSQYPVIAQQCTRAMLWLIFVGGLFAVGIFLVVISGQGL